MMPGRLRVQQAPPHEGVIVCVGVRLECTAVKP